MRAGVFIIAMLLCAPGGAACASSTEYIVKHGDTLYSVAQASGLGMKQVMTQNRLASPVLHAGQVLRLSGGRPAVAETTSFLWPVRGKIISGYGPKNGGLYNDGINIAAPRGTPVRAAAEGTIAYIGHAVESYGNLVLIRHAGGVITAYAHLAGVTAHQGMHVKKGDTIGSVGSTGAVQTAQLHFEIRRGVETLDPARYL